MILSEENSVLKNVVKYCRSETYCPFPSLQTLYYAIKLRKRKETLH